MEQTHSLHVYFLTIEISKSGTSFGLNQVADEIKN